MPKTQLVVVSVLQSWQPESRAVLNMLEDVWGEWTRIPLPESASAQASPRVGGGDVLAGGAAGGVSGQSLPVFYGNP